MVQVSLPRDRETGRGRGFGFVTLASREDAEIAKSALDGRMKQGQTLSVRPFQGRPAGGGPRPPLQASASLYVANLPFEASEEDLREVLRERGIGARDVRLPQERGATKGYGFVTLDAGVAVDHAVEVLNGALVKGRPMVVKEARPRGSSPEPRRVPEGNAPSDNSARQEDSRRREAPPPRDRLPSLAPPWEEPLPADRRRAVKPVKKVEKEAKAKNPGRPKSSKDRARAGKNWSKSYDNWDDD